MQQIIGWILYGVLLFLTVGWMMGVRYKADVIYPTVLGSIYFLALSIVVPLVGINKVHLLWLLPLVYVMTLGNTYIWAYRVPVISKLLSGVCDIYTSALRVGMRRGEMRRKENFR